MNLEQLEAWGRDWEWSAVEEGSRKLMECARSIVAIKAADPAAAQDQAVRLFAVLGDLPPLYLVLALEPVRLLVLESLFCHNLCVRLMARLGHLSDEWGLMRELMQPWKWHPERSPKRRCPRCLEMVTRETWAEGLHAGDPVDSEVAPDDACWKARLKFDQMSSGQRCAAYKQILEKEGRR